MAFYYIRQDELASYGATVTTTVGATDSDYNDDWICDGRCGRPARSASFGSPSTTGTVTWSASFSSAQVGLIAVCNCNSNVNATIGGGVTGTVIAGALGENGIRLSGWLAPTPVTITGLTVGFSGAADDVVLGEFVFGKRRTLTNVNGGNGGPRMSDLAFELIDFAEDDQGEFISVPPYDRGLEQRRLKG